MGIRPSDLLEHCGTRLAGAIWVRLREKGGRAHTMPCHHNLENYLTAYLEKTGIADDPKGPLFPTVGRRTKQLTRTPLSQPDAYRMIERRTETAGIKTKICNYSFRATGITAYLKNGGTPRVSVREEDRDSSVRHERRCSPMDERFIPAVVGTAG
jgi:integrase